ncbi:MAG TPA: hypothetical protein VH912_01695 [Streptosporangiaceae bacterium]|jgi:hypothetical protein
MEMFQIWEAGEPGTIIAKATTLDVALDKVDTLCRLRHDQAMAKIERAQERRFQFEVRDQKARTLARLFYSPDTTRPYKSVIVEELLKPA